MEKPEFLNPNRESRVKDFDKLAIASIGTKMLFAIVLIRTFFIQL